MGRGGKRPGAGRKPQYVDLSDGRRLTPIEMLTLLQEPEAWREVIAGAKADKNWELLFRCLTYWRDRLEGRAGQSVRHSGPAGEPIRIHLGLGGSNGTGTKDHHMPEVLAVIHVGPSGGQPDGGNGNPGS